MKNSPPLWQKIAFIGIIQRFVLVYALMYYLYEQNIDTRLYAQISCPTQRISASSGIFADRTDAAPLYQANQDCYWLIQPQEAQIIRLTFLRFSTEVNADILTIYDGADTNAPVRARLSGQALPQPITSSAGVLLIRFRTNAIVQERGWVISFTSSSSRLPLLSTPSECTFAPILFGESSIATVTLTVPDDRSELLLRASNGFQIALSSSGSTTFSDTISLASSQIQFPNRQIPIFIRFRPTAVGRFSGILNAVNGARELTIPLFAQSLPAIYWKPASGPFSASIQSLSIAPNQTIFAGTLTGVYRSSAAGAAWLQALDGLNANSELTIQTLVAYEKGVFAGTQKGLFRSLDNGRTWQKIARQLNDANVTGLSSTQATVYVCANGALFSSRTNGDLWERLQSTAFTNISLTTVFSEKTSNGALLLASGLDTVTKTSALVISRDDGKTWTRDENFTVGTARVLALAILQQSNNGEIFFAATAGRGLFRKNIDGRWDQVQKPQANNEFVRDTVSQIIVRKSTVFASSTLDGVYRSDDGGLTWKRLVRGLAEQTVKSLIANDVEIYAGTTAGVYRSTNDGELWQPVSTGLTGAVVTAIKEIRGFLLAGTLGSGIFRSSDNGVTWQLANNGLSARSLFNFVSRAGVVYTTSFDTYSPGDRIIPGVYRSADNGLTWSRVLEDSIGLSNNRHSFFGLINSERGLYAGADAGHVWQSPNGFSWRLLKIPQANTPVTAITEGIGVSIFAATSGNGVFRSDDDGVTWIPMRLPNSNDKAQTAYSIFSNQGTIFIGTFQGLFRSRNNGASWELLNFPAIAEKPTSMQSVDGVLYVATDGNGIWRTVDNGDTWQEINDGIAGREAQVYSLFSSNGTDLYAGLRGGAVISTSLQLPSDAPRAVLFIPDSLAAKVGDTVEIPIILRSLTGNLAGTKIISGFLRFNASMLMPLSEEERQSSTVQNGERQIPLRFPLTNTVGSQLITLRLRAVLGNNIATPLMLTNIQTTPSDAIVTMPEIGTFTAKGLFTGGGTRLYRSQGAPTIITIAPNPAPEQATVVFELQEKTMVTLSLANIFGQTIRTFSEKQFSEGRFEALCPLHNLPAGTYFFVLTTPQHRVTTPISILR